MSSWGMSSRAGEAGVGLEGWRFWVVGEGEGEGRGGEVVDDAMVQVSRGERGGGRVG